MVGCPHWSWTKIRLIFCDHLKGWWFLRVCDDAKSITKKSKSVLGPFFRKSNFFYLPYKPWNMNEDWCASSLFCMFLTFLVQAVSVPVGQCLGGPQAQWFLGILCHLCWKWKQGSTYSFLEHFSYIHNQLMLFLFLFFLLLLGIFLILNTGNKFVNSLGNKLHVKEWPWE